MRYSPLLTLACAGLLLPAAAHADGVKITQHVFSEDGQPVLVANYQPNGALATPSWKVCAPDCGPTVLTGNQLQPGPTANGTTFEASATVGETTTTDRSRPWNGQVTNTVAPTISGEAKVGGTVSGAAGTWTGGWGDDYSTVELRACRAADGTSCVRLPSASAVIDSAYAGWYIGSIDSRYGREAAFPAFAWPAPIPGQPSGVPVPPATQTTVYSALIGPIAGLPAPPANDPPRIVDPPVLLTGISLRKRAKVVDGRRVVGTVRCSFRCVARVTYSQGGHKLSKRVVVRSGNVTLVAPSGFSVKRKLSVKVRFDEDARTKSAKVALR